jgi:hypothetical protein
LDKPVIGSTTSRPMMAMARAATTTQRVPIIVTSHRNATRQLVPRFCSTSLTDGEWRMDGGHALKRFTPWRAGRQRGARAEMRRPQHLQADAND